MSVETPDVAADGRAKRRLENRCPRMETNGQAALVIIDEPAITGVIQVEQQADAGTLHETLAAAYWWCDRTPGLLTGGGMDAE